MLTESSLDNSNEFIEAELSKVEEHMLQLLEDMNRDIIWVNRTQNGIVPGALNILKNFYSDLEAFHILEALVRKGMLERVDNGILLLCPSCGSHESSIIQSCPSCGSIKLRQKHKVVHAPCEHWGTFDEFEGGNTLTCPICSESIESDKILENKSGFSYSDPYYECQECNFSSNKVRSQYLCTSCKKKFQTSNAVKLEQTGFTVTVEPIERPEQTEIAPTPEIDPRPEEVAEPEESVEPEEEVQPKKKKPPKKRKPVKLLDEILKRKDKKEKEKKKTRGRTTSKKNPDKVEANIEKTVAEPQILEEEPEPVTESRSIPEPVALEMEPEVEPEVIPEPEEEVMETEVESEAIPEPVEEVMIPETEPEEIPAPAIEVEKDAPSEQVEEVVEPEIEPKVTPKPVEEVKEPEIIPEPVEEVIESETTTERVEEAIEPEIEQEEISAPVIAVENEVLPEPAEEEFEPEIEPEEIVAPSEKGEQGLDGALSGIEEIYEEDLDDEDDEEPEEDAYKILFVVENQMVCNFVLDGLQSSKLRIELNLVEDGALALKALRRLYDMIIFDSGLESVDPKFVITEMCKWKIKTPMVIIDEGALGKIPKELKVLKKLKRKQRDLRRITNIISKNLKKKSV